MTMKISVIIVNYNVRHFLEQCLHSVYKSVAGIDAEIFVVDNASADGSCQMVREKFPGVTLIRNEQNTGFSVANNQAIRVASGEYVLLLNITTTTRAGWYTAGTSSPAATPAAPDLKFRGCLYRRALQQ